MSRFLVLMSDNRPLTSDINLASYNSLAVAINYEYCKKHGYDFKYYIPYLNSHPLLISLDPVTGKLRHAAWTKLLSVLHDIDSDYDYIVYIDSDCIFKDFDMTLDKFMSDHSSYNLVFLCNKPFSNPQAPCSGFFIVKVCEESKKILKDWYCFDFAGRKNPFKFEQGAMFYIYETLNIKVLDLWMFEEMPDQFLRHISTRYETQEPGRRINYFTKFLNDKCIDFSQNINAIYPIKYDSTEFAIKTGLLK